MSKRYPSISGILMALALAFGEWYFFFDVGTWEPFGLFSPGRLDRDATRRLHHQRRGGLA